MAALPPQITDATVTTKPYSWVPSTGIYYGYCQISDVQAEFLDRSNMTSSVQNPIFVAQCIIDTGIEMSNALEAAYVMPYVGANMSILGTLNKINRKLAASEVVARVFGANEPDTSTWGLAQREYAESCLVGILDGEEQWAAPYGDALPNGEKVIFPHSAIAQIYPNAGVADPYSRRPIFSMGDLRYRKPNI